MRRALIFLTLGLAAPALAQVRLPVIVPLKGQPQAPLQGIDILRADFLARTGSDTVYFGNDSSQLGPPARTVLQTQALWLLQHPAVQVRIEGHGDGGDTRDHALAVGARRAEEVRDYMILLGVSAGQISAMSWGKERPGAPRATTVLAP
jgi:peptidoglycan-associated lipoprotein